MKVLVIAEHHKNKLAPSTASTITAALKIAPKCDVLLASDEAILENSIARLQGVETVWVTLHPRFKHLLAEDLTPVIAELAKEYTHILAPATTFGKNLLPRVAAVLDVAQVSEVCAIESADIFVRPIYAGNAYVKLRSHDPIKLLTIRTTAFDPIEELATDASLATITPLEIVQPFPQIEFKSELTPELVRPELTSAKVIVSGGRGLKNAENFKQLEAFADKIGAAVGASRAAVDAGFVSNDFQVGQTGKVVAPQLYIAVGISGAIQHLAGMKDSKIIVAINKDPEAPIFQVADYGLVGDWFAILPELEQALLNK